MPLDRQGINSGAWSGRPPHRPGPQLPAFCRSRRPTVMVTATSLAGLRGLVLLGLLFQLGTLLLVLAGPVPPRPVTSPNTFFRSDAGIDAAELPPVTPLSDR